MPSNDFPKKPAAGYVPLRLACETPSFLMCSSLCYVINTHNFSPSWGPKKKKKGLAVRHCKNSSAQHRSKLANKSKTNPVLPCLILLYHYTYKSLISRWLRNLRFSLIKHKTCCVWERMWRSRGRTEKYTRKWTREIFNDYYIWYDRVKVTARCIPPLVHLKEMHLWDMASAHRVVSVHFYLCPVV